MRSNAECEKRLKQHAIGIDCLIIYGFLLKDKHLRLVDHDVAQGVIFCTII